MDVPESSLAQALLLCGDWGAARELTAPKEVLGWSFSSADQGLVVSAVLAALGEQREELPPSVALQWEGALSLSLGYHAEPELLPRMKTAHQQACRQFPMGPNQKAAMWVWCIDVVRQRIRAIVGGQHRGSYDKAARLAAAGAEMLRAQGDETQARKLLEEVREEFPRHRAFQAELLSAVRRMDAGTRGTDS